MNIKSMAFAMLLFTGLSLSANTDCKEQLKSYLDLISCAEKRSPNIQSAELELKRSKEQIKASTQWRNPEISVQSVRGKLNSQTVSETDFSLGIPIELGGKISARSDLAESESSLAEALLFEAKAQIKTEVLLKLHRLRQLIHEQEIIDESISTFSKLVSQYAKRPSLSPEQQMNSAVFQMSKGDYELRKSESMDELLQLEAYFKLQLGLPLEALKKALPTPVSSWPQLKENSSARLSPAQRRLFAELDTAKAELSMAESEAWPTLTLGPSLKIQEDAGQKNNLIGFNVSLPLPLFNLNGSAKAAARAKVDLNLVQKDIGLTEQKLKKAELTQTYEQTIKVLKSSLSHDEIEKRHQQIERQFQKGVIPSSLVIEAHRTMLDLERSRHNRELKAVESFMMIHTINGTILEVQL